MKDTHPHKATQAGLLAGIAAYVMWGFFPAYFKWTASVAPMEILAHRIIWSLPFAALIITIRKQWPEVIKALLRPKTLLALALAALFIGGNWGLYIWAVQNNHIFQASLGYYINPLIFVLVGVVFLGESLSRLQTMAVLFACVGVGLLTWYGGEFPWIALVLATSFTLYGIIRKQVKIGAVPGLFVEVLLLFLPALSYILYLAVHERLDFLQLGPGMSSLLVLAGPLTVLPLVAFAFAARRLRLSTIGFLQFIGPSLQFLMGVVYGEPLTPAVLWCFGFIWLAASVFTLDALRKYRRDKAPILMPERPGEL